MLLKAAIFALFLTITDAGSSSQKKKTPTEQEQPEQTPVPEQEEATQVRSQQELTPMYEQQEPTSMQDQQASTMPTVIEGYVPEIKQPSRTQRLWWYIKGANKVHHNKSCSVCFNEGVNCYLLQGTGEQYICIDECISNMARVFAASPRCDASASIPLPVVHNLNDTAPEFLKTRVLNRLDPSSEKCLHCDCFKLQGIPCVNGHNDDRAMAEEESTPFDRNLNLARAAQACPGCGRWIQRIEACDHMRCPTCMTNFCYVCGERDYATRCRRVESDELFGIRSRRVRLEEAIQAGDRDPNLQLNADNLWEDEKRLWREDEKKRWFRRRKRNW